MWLGLPEHMLWIQRMPIVTYDYLQLVTEDIDLGFTINV